MSSKKRSRPVVEENRAECPFTITYPAPYTRAEQDRGKSSKKRKREVREVPDDEKKPQVQMSPFAPIGKFKTHDTLDLHYAVEPRKRWLDMTRYNSFVLNGTKYYSEGFVFVANESTIERQKSASAMGVGAAKKKDDDWVARILEIRAADEHHVYARVYWMYWPDELPAGTIDGKKTIQGRQPYHGQNELIASNHMDVINVVSVTMPATVNQWIEADDEEIQDALYWRQAYDTRNGQLSSVDLTCKCETPANPDKTLIGCTNNECNKWMHDDCLTHDILMRVYDRLGTDKPHRKEPPKDEKGVERAARPLSPTEAGEIKTQPTIDVRAGESQDNVLVRKATEETPQPNDTPSRAAQDSNPDSLVKSSAAKRGRKKKPTMDTKPYEGLFKATMIMNGEGPTFWEIEDLRENVTGGDKTWTEQGQCLLCGAVIS